MTMLVPILAGIGALCMSNPRRRRKARRNPHQRNRDLTEHAFTRGSARVAISTWRNKSGTAFIQVGVNGPDGTKLWEAHSQGPSSGGYSKPTQAAERVYHKIAGVWPGGAYNHEGLLLLIADSAAAKVGAKINPRRRGRGRRNPPYHAHVGPVYMRNGRRNPSGAREPYESEKGSALLRHFMLLKKRGHFGQSYGEPGSNDGAHSLCNIYNDAVAPHIYRSEADAKVCKRVAMLCRRVRTNNYSSRSIGETLDGTWESKRRNPRRGRRSNPIHEIHRGDRVTIRTPHGNFTGKAYLLGPAGWVLGAGPHGSRVKIATADNIVSVRAARR
jgi:hypothetical protein